MPDLLKKPLPRGFFFVLRSSKIHLRGLQHHGFRQGAGIQSDANTWSEWKHVNYPEDPDLNQHQKKALRGCCEGFDLRRGRVQQILWSTALPEIIMEVEKGSLDPFPHIKLDQTISNLSFVHFHAHFRDYDLSSSAWRSRVA